MITEAFLKSHVFDYKNEITKTPYIVDAAAFTGEEEGRFDVDFNSVMLECFIKSSEVKRLFVFFSAAGREKFSQKTEFNRISWCSKLNGLCLYVEDPMYKKYGELVAGWYYGTASEIYLLNVLELVKKIAATKNIDTDEIYFTGGSAAGYAALFCADVIKGSVAYAYNPQVILERSPNARKFHEVTGINLSDHTDTNRNDLRFISQNKQSQFYIFFNTSSKRDHLQYQEWMQSIGLPITDGLHIHNKIHFLLKGINNTDPHICVADINDFITTISLAKMPEEIKKDVVEANLNRFKNYILTEELNYHRQLFIKFMSNKIPAYLDFIPDKTLNSLNYSVKGIKNVRYKVECFKLKRMATVSLLINRNEKIFNTGFREKLNEICLQHKIRIVDNPKFSHIRLNKSITHLDSIYKESMEFIYLTYKEVLSFYLMLGMMNLEDLHLEDINLVQVENMKAYMDQIIID